MRKYPHTIKQQDSLSMEEKKQEQNSLVWQGPEHVTKQRGADWFLVVGIVTLSLAISTLIFGNVLFAVLIVVASFALTLFALREPAIVTFSLTPQGLVVDDKKYPFAVLESFWITEPEGESARLVFQSGAVLMHHLVIPLQKVDVDEVRNYLLDYIPEEEIYEPLSHQIMEYLGF